MIIFILSACAAPESAPTEPAPTATPIPTEVPMSVAILTSLFIVTEADSLSLKDPYGVAVDSEGNVIETIENPKFCGCGHSQEKPFCDGSHKGFLDKKD